MKRRPRGNKYEVFADFEREKVKDGYKRIGEYEHFYLYEKYQNGVLLYRECFSKFDIDGVRPTEAKCM